MLVRLVMESVKNFVTRSDRQKIKLPAGWPVRQATGWPLFWWKFFVQLLLHLK